MGNLTKSWKAQTVNIIGIAPSNKWSTSLNWGQAWGYKTAGAGGFQPLIFNFQRIWTKTNTYTMTDTPPAIGFTKVWSGSNRISFSYANQVENQKDGSGNWSYIFIDGVTNKESAAASINFTSQTVTALAWTSNVVSSVTWS